MTSSHFVGAEEWISSVEFPTLEESDVVDEGTGTSIRASLAMVQDTSLKREGVT
jgi:hypothetical protein